MVSYGPREGSIFTLVIHGGQEDSPMGHKKPSISRIPVVKPFQRFACLNISGALNSGVLAVDHQPPHTPATKGDNV